MHVMYVQKIVTKCAEILLRNARCSQNAQKFFYEMRVVTKCAEILLRNSRCYKMRRNFVTKCVRCYIMRSCFKMLSPGFSSRGKQRVAVMLYGLIGYQSANFFSSVTLNTQYSISNNFYDNLTLKKCVIHLLHTCNDNKSAGCFLAALCLVENPALSIEYENNPLKS